MDIRNMVRLAKKIRICKIVMRMHANEADGIQEVKCAVLAACADMLEVSIIETNIREEGFRYFNARQHPSYMIRDIVILRSRVLRAAWTLNNRSHWFGKLIRCRLKASL